MRSRVSVLALAVLVAVAASASAQYRGGTVELSGFAGYLVGGNIGHFHDFNNNCCHTDLDVDDHLAYGGRIGYNFNNRFEIETEYTQSDTHLELDTHNNLPNQQIADLRFQYFMAYMTVNFGGSSRFIPYFTLGSGAANLRSEFPGFQSQSEVRYTASAGGGIKIFLNPHFAFRFDGRFYSTYLSGRAICGPDFCTNNTWVTNFVPNGGLVFAF
jgi:opacity protein-like surface antigen